MQTNFKKNQLLDLEIQNSEKLDHVNSLSLNTGPFITSKNYTNNKRKIFEVSQPIVMSNKKKHARIQNQFENEFLPYHTYHHSTSISSTSIPSKDFIQCNCTVVLIFKQS